mmetsp:Transcript_36328/g.32048  ORF Transcript_36328/g.32048 Transcript_36328/m.32048 type:complete len:179 (-) Transcript_36328:44-580(-)
MAAEPTIVQIQYANENYGPESHHHHELRPHPQNEIYPHRERRNTNPFDDEPEQTNIVYIDDIDNNKADDDEDLLKPFCCATCVILIGVVFTVIGFLWIIDPTPYTDCAMFQDSNGCIDQDDGRYRYDDESHDKLNDTSIAFLIFGLFMIVVGSLVCYNKLKKDDNDNDNAQNDQDGEH